MEDLFGMLPGLLDRFDEPGEVRSAVVFAAWRRVAGESLRNHTIPVELSDKRLTIYVRDETWKKHLEELAGQMIFKLNSVLGKAMVTFIEFEVNENEFSSFGDSGISKTMEDTENRSGKEISPELRDAATAIEDEVLRERFLLAAKNCLARKRRASNFR